jgi:hypothetical protein
VESAVTRVHNLAMAQPHQLVPELAVAERLLSEQRNAAHKQSLVLSQRQGSAAPLHDAVEKLGQQVDEVAAYLEDSMTKMQLSKHDTGSLQKVLIDDRNTA